jgi:hypothetical protein
MRLGIGGFGIDEGDFLHAGDCAVVRKLGLSVVAFRSRRQHLDDENRAFNLLLAVPMGFAGHCNISAEIVKPPDQ